MAANNVIAEAVVNVRLDTSQVPRQTSEAANNISKGLASADARLRGFGRGFNAENVTRPLGRITASFGEFNKSLEASNARVLAFGASVGVLYNIQRAFKELAVATVDVEKSLKDINILLNLSKRDLKDFGDSLFEVAKNTNSSFATVAKAATELSRQGLSAQETLKRTRDALILVQLTGVDAEAAVSDITAALNSFNRTALDSTILVNKLARVDAQFAVSAGDLAEAIRRVGSTAQDAGVGLDELISLVTAVQQTTARGGSVIGNSFKTIFSRLQRTETLDQLEALGVAVRDLQGNVIPANQILNNLATVYDKLGQSQKAQLTEMVGGVYQMNILKAVVGDLGKQFSVYDSALKASTGATTEAITRSEQLNTTLAALLNRTAVNFKQFGAKIGEETVAPIGKTILTGINDALDVVNQGDAESFGGKLGEGLVRGLAQFLSTSGVLYISTAVLSITARFSKDILQAFKAVAGINSAQQQRVALENEILARLKSQNSEGLSGLQIQQQTVAALQSELALRKQAQSLASGAAVMAARAGLVITQNPNQPIVQKKTLGQKLGFVSNLSAYEYADIPNFSPISSAISREARTTPSSIIRVGTHSSLKSSFNPSGIGVYNLRDEPGGISQGVARARSMGINPKTHGIPNFADETPQFIKDIGFRRGAKEMKAAADELERLKNEIREGRLSFNDLGQAADKFSKGFGAESNKVLNSLRLTELAARKKLRTSIEVVAGKVSGGIIPIKESRPQNLASIYGGVPYNAAGQVNPAYKVGPESAYGVTPQQRPDTLRRIEKRKQDFIEKQAAFGNQLLSNTLQDMTLLQQGVAEERKARADALRAQRRIRDAEIKRASIIETEVRGLLQGSGGLFSTLTGSKIGKAQALIAGNTRLTGLNADIEAARAQRAGRLQNIGLATSLAAPLVLNTASSFANFDTTTRSGRIGNALFGAAGDVVGLGSAGFAVGGPVGGVLGLGAGGAIGLIKTLQAYSDKLPDLQKAVEVATSRAGKLQVAFQKISTTTERLGLIESGEVKYTTQEKRNLLLERERAIEALGPEFSNRFRTELEAKNFPQIQKMTVDILEVEAENVRVAEAAAGLYGAARSEYIDSLRSGSGILKQLPPFSGLGIIDKASRTVGLPGVLDAGSNILSALSPESGFGLKTRNGKQELREDRKELLQRFFGDILSSKTTSGQTLAASLTGAGLDKTLLRDLSAGTVNEQYVVGLFESLGSALKPSQLEAIGEALSKFSDDVNATGQEQKRAILSIEEFRKSIQKTTEINKKIDAQINKPNYTRVNRALFPFITSGFSNRLNERITSRAGDRERQLSLAELGADFNKESFEREISSLRDFRTGEENLNLESELRKFDVTKSADVERKRLQKQLTDQIESNLKGGTKFVEGLSKEIEKLGKDSSVTSEFEKTIENLLELSTLKAGTPEEAESTAQNFRKLAETFRLGLKEENIKSLPKDFQEITGKLKDFFGEGSGYSDLSKTMINYFLSQETFYRELKDTGKKDLDNINFLERQRLAIEDLRSQKITGLTRTETQKEIDLITRTSDAKSNLIRDIVARSKALAEQIGKIDIGGIDRGSVTELNAARRTYEAGIVGSSGPRSTGIRARFSAEAANARAAGTSQIQDKIDEAEKERLKAINELKTVFAEQAFSTDKNTDIQNFYNKILSNLALLQQQSEGNFTALYATLDSLKEEYDSTTEASREIYAAISKLRDAAEKTESALENNSKALDADTEKIQASTEARIKAIEQNEKFERELIKRQYGEAVKKLRIGELSGEEFRNIRGQRMNEKISEKQYTGQDFLGDFTSEFLYKTQDQLGDLRDTALSTAQTIKTSFVDAFKAFTMEGKNASDAAREFGLAIASNLLTKSLEFGSKSLFGATIGSLFTEKSSGGIIKKYASGNYVTGGSGVKDDVPALLTAGEYVVNKNATAKNLALLEAINNNANLKLTNRYDYNGARPTGGSMMVSKNLSAFALTDENNPQNRLRMEREAALFDYVRDYQEYRNSQEEALKTFRRGKSQRLIGSYLNAAFSVGATAATGGFKDKGGTVSTDIGSKFTDSTGRTINMDIPKTQTSLYGRGYANGGPVGTDIVPAYLTNGEYIVSRGAANYYGKDYLDGINSRQVGKNGEQVATATSPQQIIYNNVSINISSQNGENKADVESSSNDKNQQDQMKAISMMIKEQTLRIINEQQRPGGTLYKSNSQVRY